MWRALACFLTAIAWFFAAPAHAEYIGEYDVGDTISLHCVVNDNGTAADSVSGDTIKAIIMYEGTKIDTVGLTAMGSTLPLCAAFQGKIVADTTVGGYGTWWATLWAVNVGAGTRDPVGVVSWTLYPRIASTSGIVPRVSLTDSGTSVARVANAYLTGNDKLEIARRAADSVWVGTRTTQVNGRRAYAALVADSVNAAAMLALPASAWYIGQYEHGESLTIGARLTAIDSAYATIYWRTEAIDTVELASTAQGYYLRTMADTTGGGWGDWRAVIRGYDSPSDQYVVNTWSLWDRHLYAQEVAESADVYIHDPDDSTLALVIRDSLNAWADSFKADTVVAVTNDTFHLNTADWGALSGRITDSVWTGGENSRTLSASAYGQIADSVGVSIAALDTIAYVANVGAVAVVDSARAVRTVTRSILNDSTVALQRVREVVLPVDSVVATARNWFTDSTRVLATALVLDSARVVASCDSVGKVDTVRAVARLTELLEDSIRAVGSVGVVDSVTALARNWYTDSTRATWKVRQVVRADSTVGVGRMVNPLDSVVAVGRVWDVDSARAVGRTTRMTLGDSVTGVRRLNGRVDSVSGVFRVARVDSTVGVGRLNGTVARVSRVDSAVAVFRTRLTDSTMAAGRVRYADSLRVAGLAWDVDSTRAAGISAVDSVGKVGTVTLAQSVQFADSVRAGGRVASVGVADSMVAGYRVRYVDLADSSRSVWRTAINDSSRVVSRTILTDSTTGAARVAFVDSARVSGSIPVMDSVTAVARVWDVDSTRALDHGRLVSRVSLADSAVGVKRVLLTSVTSFATVVDSTRVTRAVTGLTPATIAAEVEAIKAGGSPWPTVLAGVADDAQQAVDSLTSTEISTLAHTGDEMKLEDGEKAEIADSLLYSVQLNANYPFPTVGNILWNIQEDSLALPQTIARMGADSTRAILAASALQDSIDAALVRMGKAGGDTTLVSLLRYIKANLHAVTFPTAAISELTDSLWGEKLDSLGNLRARWDSSTAAAHLWDASPKHHGQDFVVIDSTSKDTSGVAVGAFKASGVPVTGTEIYVYTYADSGWSQPVGEDLEPASDGRFFVPVYVPANGDTIFYRVRFHAPGYLDQTKIVRFPQP